MSQIWQNIAGWLHWLMQGDNLTIALGVVCNAAVAVAWALQKLGRAKDAARLLGVVAEVESHKAGAQQTTRALEATARGLRESLKAGHVDAASFKRLTATIQAYNLEAGTEHDVLAPIVAQVNAEVPSAEVVRTATARLVARSAPAADLASGLVAGGPPPDGTAT